jgi:hypothetical protein
MLDLVPADLVYNICSFLLPRDLVRVRILSSQYADIIKVYLERNKNTTFLFNLICPLCSNDWISNRFMYQRDFLDIDEDMHYFETNERLKYVSTLFNMPAKRDHLLCEECEDTLQETPFLTHYKLPSGYQVYIDYFSEYPWALLVKNNGRDIVWNQYNCIADQAQIERSTQDFEEQDGDQHYDNQHYDNQHYGYRYGDEEEDQNNYNEMDDGDDYEDEYVY